MKLHCLKRQPNVLTLSKTAATSNSDETTSVIKASKALQLLTLLEFKAPPRCHSKIRNTSSWSCEKLAQINMFSIWRQAVTETKWYFVSLNISLSHPRSFEMTALS